MQIATTPRCSGLTPDEFHQLPPAAAPPQASCRMDKTLRRIQHLRRELDREIFSTHSVPRRRSVRSARPRLHQSILRLHKAGTPDRRGRAATWEQNKRSCGTCSPNPCSDGKLRRWAFPRICCSAGCSMNITAWQISAGEHRCCGTELLHKRMTAGEIGLLLSGLEVFR